MRKAKKPEEMVGKLIRVLHVFNKPSYCHILRIEKVGFEAEEYRVFYLKENIIDYFYAFKTQFLRGDYEIL